MALERLSHPQSLFRGAVHDLGLLLPHEVEGCPTKNVFFDKWVPRAERVMNSFGFIVEWQGHDNTSASHDERKVRWPVEQVDFSHQSCSFVERRNV